MKSLLKYDLNTAKAFSDFNLALYTITCPHPPLSVEMGFTWTFPRNQDATVKLKSDLISMKF